MDNLIFRTYVKGSGKSPDPTCGKFKGRKHVQTFEEVSSCESYGGLLQSGLVDISFDSLDLVDKFQNMSSANGWKTTLILNPSNGHIHTIWKIPKSWNSKDGKNKKLAVGLIADIHSGDTYIPLRVDGVSRIVDLSDLQEVPEELFPVDTNIRLLDLEEGDGRNDELFKYILVLQSKLGFDKEVIIRILRNTNQFVFKQPLSESEFETITRDQAFDAPIFYYGKTFLHNVFAYYLKSEFHIVRINDQLHIYDDGIYKSGYRYIERKMVQIIPTLKNNNRSEVLKFLEIITPEETEPADARYLGFRNGIYDLDTGELIPFSPDIILTNVIPWDYNPSAYSELADITLDKISCGDKDIRKVLEESIGYCFFRQNEMSKSFILTGSGSNGKSTFLDMIKNVLGRKNYVSLDMDELAERFSVSSMFGKLANIGDDSNDEFLQGKALSQFKRLVSGNDLKGENKGQDVFFFKPMTKLFFSFNEIPRMRNRGFDAIKRRLVIIPFNAKFSKEDPDYDAGITWKLKTQDVAEYLIRLGVEGLKRVLEQKGFTESFKVTDEVNQFEKDNNPILLFLDEVPEEEILNHETKEVYHRYDVYCYENGFQKIALQTFTKEIKKYLKCDRKDIRIDGKKCIVFKR